MLSSIEMLGLQCEQAWREAKKVKIPASYKKAKNVVISGMGGSALGGHVIQFLFWDKIKVPFQVINSYTIPASVSRDTLFLASSYSGTTKEVLNTLTQAQKKQAKVLGIAAGGKLGSLIKSGKMPGYVFEEKYNPCGQPRMGVGYSVFGQLGLLQKAGIIKLSDAEVKKAISWLKGFNAKFGVAQPIAKNPAKKLAERLFGKIPCIVAADFLTGNAHIFANQLNENSKNFSNYFLVSELNHHLLEGLGHPKKDKKVLEFVFIQSDLYYPRNQRRIEITKDVVENNSIGFVEYRLRGQSKLEQFLEMLILSSYVSFYLAMLNGIDPSPIPWVDYFKEQLKK